MADRWDTNKCPRGQRIFVRFLAWITYVLQVDDLYHASTGTQDARKCYRNVTNCIGFNYSFPIPLTSLCSIPGPLPFLALKPNTVITSSSMKGRPSVSCMPEIATAPSALDPFSPGHYMHKLPPSTIDISSPTWPMVFLRTSWVSAGLRSLYILSLSTPSNSLQFCNIGLIGAFYDITSMTVAIHRMRACTAAHLKMHCRSMIGPLLVSEFRKCIPFKWVHLF